MMNLPLRTGYSIPQLGLGMYLMDEGDTARQAVLHALEAGYRHFDTAALYGNERSLGQAIRESGIPREEIFVTTKLWNSDQGYEQALRAFDLSFQKLGLDYIDLYLIHWPVPGKRRDSWRALEKMQAEGRVRSLGVSNYMVRHLREMETYAQQLPTVNQFELSPYNYLRRKPEIEYCAANDIIVQAYSPLTRKQKLQDPPLVKIAREHGKTTAQVLIRWAIQMGFVVLPKSQNPTRILQNSQVFDFNLTRENLHTLNSLNENLAVSWDPTHAE